MEEDKGIYDDSEENTSTKHEKNNYDILSIQSSLNLKSYEMNIFHYFSSLNKLFNVPYAIELIIIFIESLQFFSIFNSGDYFSGLSNIIKQVALYVNLRNITKFETLLCIFGAIIILNYVFLISNIVYELVLKRKLPKILLKINAFINGLSYSVLFIPIVYNLLNFFDCSKDGNNTSEKYTCFKGSHFEIAIVSLIFLFLYQSFCFIETYSLQQYLPLSKSIKNIISNKTIKTYRRIVVLEVANTMIIKIYFKNNFLSSILTFIGFAYLLYSHLPYQNYYNQKLNCFYSSMWSCLTLQSLVYIIFSNLKLTLIYPIFIGIGVVGFVCGWFLNIFYCKYYTKKIFNNIKKKYNQQNVINKLKEEIEFDQINEDETNSLETIVTTKKVIKKEHVYKNSSDCAFVSRFINFNRSIDSFKLVMSVFKEGIFQYERDPEIYIQYWNHLHGIRKFIAINNKCFYDENSEELIEKIDYLSLKVLTKCANLAKSLLTKYLIFNATFVHENDQTLINSSNKNNKHNDDAVDLLMLDTKNCAIQYHISALNYLKDLMVVLKNIETQVDIENALIVNDNLTNVLTKGENEFRNFIKSFNYSKESLELCILFYRYSMNRADIAEQYLIMLEENENCNDREKEVDNLNPGYEKSEMMSSSMNSDMIARKTKILRVNMLHKCQHPMFNLLRYIQILTTFAIIISTLGIYLYMDCFTTVHNNVYLYVISSRSPSVCSNVKRNIRLYSLQAASGESPYGSEFYKALENEKYFIHEIYIKNIYKVQFTSTYGEYTYHPLSTGIIDEPRDINYFKTLEKMLTKIGIVLDQSNSTEILTPEYLNNKHIRYFNLNSRERFGKPFIRSLVLRNEFLQNMLIKHEQRFYYILAAISVFMLYIITLVIIPNSNANYAFIKSIVSLYKNLPPSYFNDQSTEYNDQIHETCENYETQDEGLGRIVTKKAHSTTERVKYSFLAYCLIVTVSLLAPLLTVFIYKTESQNLIDYMVNSNIRSYHIASINLYIMEHILQDHNYYSKGEPLSLILDSFNKLQTLETELKEGVYGGPFSIFDSINNNPGCYRSTYLAYECDQIKYNEYYTKELSDSSTDYMMVEYINKVNEFISNAPDLHYDLQNPVEIKDAFDYIMNDPYIQAIKRLGFDITGHIDAMNELGTQYISDLVVKYEYITLIFHIIGSLIIFFTFFIFVSGPIKRQLRVIDVLTNITFSIPSTVYNSIPKIKNFIENGNIEL